MKNIKKIFSLVMSMILSVSLVACGGAKNTSNNEKQTSSGKTLKVQFDVEIASMDPQIAVEGTSFEAIAAVTEGLYSVDAAGAPILAAAKSAEKSEDGLTYTFKLRNNKW